MDELEKSAFLRYLRSGEIESRMTTADVPLAKAMAQEIAGIAADLWPLQRLASREQANLLKSSVPFLVSDPLLEWIPEAGYNLGSGVFGDREPVLGGYEYHFNKIGAMVLVGEELILDSSFDIEKFLTDTFGKAMGEALELAFIDGDGVGKPRGFLLDCQKVTAGGAVISLADIENVYMALNPVFLPNSAWLVGQKALVTLSGIADANGNRLMVQGNAEGPAGYIFGHPVHVTLMPDRCPIAFGDFSLYKAMEKIPMLQRLNETFILSGYIGFKILQWLDAQLLKPEAVQALEV